MILFNVMLFFVDLSDGLKRVSETDALGDLDDPPPQAIMISVPNVACAQCQNGIFTASPEKLQEIATDVDLRQAFESQGGVLSASLGVPSRGKHYGEWYSFFKNYGARNHRSPLVDDGPYKGKGQCTPETLKEMQAVCDKMNEHGGRCSRTDIIDLISTHYLKSKLWSDVPLPHFTDRLWKIDTSYAVDGASVSMLHKYGLYVIENFITPTEADHMVQISLGKFEDAGIGCPVLRHNCYDRRFLTFPGNHCELRTSSSLGHDNPDATLKRILSKHETLTNVPQKFFEHTQTMQYEPGQFFSSHYDDDACEDQISEVKENCKSSVRRMVTVLTYLNDDHKGGATYFPDLNIRVFPKKGSAIVFFPVSVDGLLNPYMRHSGEEPSSNSTKYVMQQWMLLGGAMSPTIV